MSKLFSVIIPTFNRAEQIRNALEHLSRQTFKDFDVWVCDDGSTDHTKKIVNEYTQLVDIKYLWFENWGGPAKPRNEGIKNCTGKWVCFLDSDDWWYPNKLAEVANYVDEYDFIYHYLDIWPNNTFNKRVSEPLKENILNDLVINGNKIANSSACVKKSLLISVGKLSEDKSLIAMEDYDLWIRLAAQTDKFKFIDQSLGVYNWGEQSNISHISLQRIIKEQAIFSKHTYLLNKEDQVEAQKVLDYKIGRYYAVLGLYSKSILCLKHSFFSRSISVKLKSLLFLVKFYIIYLSKRS